MTTIRVPLAESAQVALVKRAKLGYPNEVCGFIMNSADPGAEQFVFEVPNVHPRPEHHWRMDPGYQALAMQDEDNIFGVFHTHPHGPDGPSETDLRYMIPGLRFFVATFNGVFEYEMGNR
jgi:proteasome lid subunit RPN8/RPN11